MLALTTMAEEGMVNVGQLVRERHEVRVGTRRLSDLTGVV
jgi:hypothetical protein